MADGLILVGFTAMILFYLKDYKSLIIRARKKNTDKMVLAIGILPIFGGIYYYGETWFHYTVGILATIMFVLSVVRTGITAKGFLIAVEPGILGNWSLLENVKVELNDKLRVTIRRRYGLRKEIHYYDKEDYAKVISLLTEYLPRKKIKVV